MEVSAHPRLITEVDGRPHGGSLSADGRIHFALPSLHGENESRSLSKEPVSSDH
jgi:hypothetical protein